jgi:hypothetical protein
LSSTPSRRVGPCGLHISFEWASSLAGTRYTKHEDPMGRVLVNTTAHIAHGLMRHEDWTAWLRIDKIADELIRS